ncbi:hypothetical protein ASF69_01440 [Rhizobium sp. Leaf311]|uniref:DUF4145 domain-containing protein n=1 Tax=Rhizobium sp. Leaf311 TaxID=1736332 RepID=UPI000714F604|nr:DUF4145 domain-containing protein [Rhizobium sp. Leaf311]KQQ61113.1 hypothetical protein ASF69_01440 [Rhizobium sp. Leaf311]
MEEDKPIQHETGRSVSARENTGDHDIYEGRFHAILRCDDTMCGEVAVVSGEAHLCTEGDPHMDFRNYQQWTMYEVRSVIPPPPIIQLPPKLPTDVEASIRAAFSLYWIDLEACANKIRKALEQTLTERGFPKIRKNENLQERIQRFAQSSVVGEDASKVMQAIRHVGNSGSHENNKGLDRQDILNAFAFLEHAVTAIYGRLDLSERVDAVTAKHSAK